MGWSIGRGLTAGAALIVAILLINAGLSYFSVRQLHDDAAAVNHTHEVLHAVGEVLSTVRDIEAKQRGFIVTGNDALLRPLDDAHQSLPVLVERVRTLTADNPKQQARIPDLKAHVQTATESLSRGAAARKDQGFEAAREYVLNGRTRRALDALQALLGEMEQTERDLLEERTGRRHGPTPSRSARA